MKVRRIVAISQRGFPTPIYRVITLLAPEGIQGGGQFRIEAPPGHALAIGKIQAIVSLCKLMGVPWSKFGDTGTLGYMVERIYEEEDFEDCGVLQLVGMEPMQEAYERDAQGRLIVKGSNMHLLNKLGRAGKYYVVSREGREMLEAADLAGLTFHETHVQRASNFSAGQAECWELAASLTLPRMSNRNLWYLGTKQHPKPKPFDGDYSRPVYIHEPPFAAGEMHYRASDLMFCQPFDLARSLELGGGLLISRRLYRLLRRERIPIIVRPVRIDPG